MKKISKGDIEIFLGKKYGYIIQQGLNKDEYLFRHKCPSISIVSLAHATQSANSLSHNDRLYQQWQRQQGSKSQRLEPAPIKIDQTSSLPPKAVVWGWSSSPFSIAPVGFKSGAEAMFFGSNGRGVHCLLVLRHSALSCGASRSVPWRLGYLASRG